MSDIRVEIQSTLLNLKADWLLLMERAVVAASDGNVFLDPVALNVAFELGFAKVFVLLAWQVRLDARRLVGVWALQSRKLSPFGPTVLTTPPYEYAFVGTPVVDPEHADAAAAAWLDAIAADKALPNVLSLKYLDAGSAGTAAVVRELSRRTGRTHVLAERSRPYVTPEVGRKLSGATRKKMRQDWNRLAALGPVDLVNDRDPSAVSDAFEAFLTLEAASWKGSARTALLARPRDAAFTRRLIGALAADGKASVALLRSDGRPIAAQVLLYSGRQAYTWKIAYDADFAKYSPGAVLVDKITEELFADGIAAIESCSPEGGFMTKVWSGRRVTLDLLAEVGERHSPVYDLARLHDSGRAELKALYQRLRSGRQAAVHAPQGH